MTLAYDVDVVVIGHETGDGRRERCRYQFQHDGVDAPALATLLRQFADRLEEMAGAAPVLVVKTRARPKCRTCGGPTHGRGTCPAGAEAGP